MILALPNFHLFALTGFWPAEVAGVAATAGKWGSFIKTLIIIISQKPVTSATAATHTPRGTGCPRISGHGVSPLLKRLFVGLMYEIRMNFNLNQADQTA